MLQTMICSADSCQHKI